MPRPSPRALRLRKAVQLSAADWPAILLRLCCLSLAVFLAAPLLAEPSPTDHDLGPNASAYHALLEGRAGEATALLNSTLAQHPADALAHQLLCRVFYAQEQADLAIQQCEAAVAGAPASSDNELWLGRAYGLKARHAGPIAGFSLARKVHASFEHAVQLDPANVAALNDLGEYYVGAPSIVGGGNDKARDLAARLLPKFPVAAHRLLALIAQDAKDLPAAESEFKEAVASQKLSDGHSTAEAWIDLANFYQSHNRPDDALAAVRSGLAVDRTHGPVLVDAASILSDAHRSPDLAERCLRDYLAGHAQSDAAPTFKAHLQLSRLLQARGDASAASREVAAAAALAPAFTHLPRTAQGL